MATFLKDATFSGSNGSHFKLRLEYEYTQSQADNKTTITYYNYFQSKDGWSGSGSADSITGYINGSKVGTTNSIGVNATKLLGSKVVEITHNADGTFPTTSYTAKIDSAWNNVNRAELSGSLTSSNIPKIDRYPMITEAPNFNDEDNPKIKYTTALGFTGATVQAGIKVGDTIVVSLRDVVVADGEYTFELDSTERNALRNATPNSNTLAVQFLLRTTYNGTNYDSTSNKTMSIVNANPTFSVAYQDTNATTLAITNNNQQIIQNNSTLQVNITSATALKGASLSSVDININGTISTESISSATKNVNIGALNIASDINAIVTLKDSRNNMTTITLPITILSWSLPTAIITLNRKNNFYTETDINVDANYSSLDSKNTITIKMRQKKTSEGSYGSYTNLSDNVTTTFNADNTYEWDIQVLVQDAIGSTTYNLTLGIGQPILFVDRRRRNVGIDCFPDSTNAFEVNGNAKVSGNLIVGNENVINKIDDYLTYSTTANIIGYWIDGRPIYRKTYHLTTTAGWQSFPESDISNDIDILINIGGIVKQSSGTQVPIPYYINSSDFANVYYAPQSNYFVVTTGASYGFGDTYIYIDYVETL